MSNVECRLDWGSGGLPVGWVIADWIGDCRSDWRLPIGFVSEELPIVLSGVPSRLRTIGCHGILQSTMCTPTPQSRDPAAPSPIVYLQSAIDTRLSQSAIVNPINNPPINNPIRNRQSALDNQ